MGRPMIPGLFGSARKGGGERTECAAPFRVNDIRQSQRDALYSAIWVHAAPHASRRCSRRQRLREQLLSMRARERSLTRGVHSAADALFFPVIRAAAREKCGVAGFRGRVHCISIVICNGSGRKGRPALRRMDEWKRNPSKVHAGWKWRWVSRNALNLRCCPVSRASEARPGTQWPHDEMEQGRCCASHFLRWVPGLPPLGQAGSLRSPGTRASARISACGTMSAMGRQPRRICIWRAVA
jgi:hypothetical protein